jgi:hypothetical protein
MEIKRILSTKEAEEASHVKKIQPITESFLRENYDIILEDIEWDRYAPGKYISKYA